MGGGTEDRGDGNDDGDLEVGALVLSPAAGEQLAAIDKGGTRAESGLNNRSARFLPSPEGSPPSPEGSAGQEEWRYRPAAVAARPNEEATLALAVLKDQLKDKERELQERQEELRGRECELRLREQELDAAREAEREARERLEEERRDRADEARARERDRELSQREQDRLKMELERMEEQFAQLRSSASARPLPPAAVASGEAVEVCVSVSISDDSRAPHDGPSASASQTNTHAVAPLTPGERARRGAVRDFGDLTGALARPPANPDQAVDAGATAEVMREGEWPKWPGSGAGPRVEGGDEEAVRGQAQQHARAIEAGTDGDSSGAEESTYLMSQLLAARRDQVCVCVHVWLRVIASITHLKKAIIQEGLQQEVDSLQKAMAEAASVAQGERARTATRAQELKVTAHMLIALLASAADELAAAVEHERAAGAERQRAQGRAQEPTAAGSGERLRAEKGAQAPAERTGGRVCSGERGIEDEGSHELAGASGAAPSVAAGASGPEGSPRAESRVVSQVQTASRAASGAEWSGERAVMVEELKTQVGGPWAECGH